ncbi:Transposase DDE domain protein [Maioricimonas rarisocia]|uniref:Transposase DDE domain protein n=1 Tax=Maioricimonas rarisocia TaxID=2528026 RepID=A0A517YZZ9_9PLAN|nr:IS4 family transposase [Maioricimonas rarisocia]QDU35774.1 Transposase DDE domain protein [Maioricimonas rarisocia]QDU35801.1 Transposase DDE domain protein [Maioricimonas rarisocia]QDU35843.1 Transposase DDE domain protein [Maioricimonas rarisocia]QDU35946.1 Transposase DDE domain protein [Maioricimonas rarisocia]QDU36602.1 Transposase DDE domain protein [Maioricimonas rarisocia]
MLTDEPRYDVWEQIRQQDLKAFARLLPESLVVQAAERADVRIVRSALAIPNLVWLGVLSALHSTKSFARILTLTAQMLDLSANGLPEAVARSRRNAARRKPKASKHSPRGKDPATVTEEAFTQARRRMPVAVWFVLIELLTARFEEQHQDLIRWKRFRLLALDGTTIRLPQHNRLAEHFGTSSNGRYRVAQARMVMLQLPLVRLPWRYELGPVDEGERTVAARLLKQVRRNDLVLMDQGFWSYGLFHQIQAARGYFAIRQYPGVRMKTLRRLGPRDRIVRWKTPSGPRWRNANLPESITLRVINYQIKGFPPSAVVTNVLGPKRISREDWIRMATEAEPGHPLDPAVRKGIGLYHRRWEIETTFQELKVYQGLERTLRSHSPESVQYEVAGHVVLYLLVRWLMVEAAQRSTGDGDPLGVSFKHALEELVTAWPLLLTSTSTEVNRRVLPKLLAAIASHEVQWRPGRTFARKTSSASKKRRRKKSARQQT